MLLDQRSPGPPWLPVPPFADVATLVAGGFEGVAVELVAALVFVDPRFEVVSATPWTVLGTFGLRLGAGEVAVPDGARWWAVGVSRLDDGAALSQPWEAFRVRWRLQL